jgi:hypothetical protein
MFNGVIRVSYRIPFIGLYVGAELDVPGVESGRWGL